jgi:hypothetical protein
MKPAATLLGVLLGLAAGSSAQAQQCPPRAGFAPNWCHSQKLQGPGAPARPSPPGQVHQPRPGPGYQPGFVYPPGLYQPNYEVVCIVDNGYCSFLASSSVIPGTSCYCGEYQGATQ